MDTENLVGLLLSDELDETVSVEVGLGASVGREAEFADVVLHAGLLQVLLGLTDPGNFGMGVDDGGDGPVVDMTMSVLDELNSGNTCTNRSDAVKQCAGKLNAPSSSAL